MFILHDQKEIDESMETLRNVMEICQRKRRPANVLSVIWKPNYNLYTDGNYFKIILGFRQTINLQPNLETSSDCLMS